MRKLGSTLQVLLAVQCLVVLVAGCSGKASGKAPGPAVATGKPCETECCCRTQDGYYVRHDCTSAAECSESGGRCLAADTDRCRH